MELLKDILYKVKLLSSVGDVNSEIQGICFDSRQVVNGSLFVAVKGTQVDGHAYIEQALGQGATAIVCETLPDSLKEGIAYIQTENSAEALGIISSNFYDNPSTKLKLVGVTGTNGKTTVVTLLHRLFTAMGYQCGLLSTVENKIGERVLQSTHTTPDQVSLNALLDQMVKEKCQFAFMEVSSHAIDQHRIAGLEFAGAVFMNITHDHLDYHGTFEHYINTKKKLFDGLPASAFALTNSDDKRGMVMLQNTRATKKTFGLKYLAEYKAKILTNSYQGLELDINNQSVWFRLIGGFNAYNLLAVFATADLLDEDKQEVLMTLSGLQPATGRFEIVNPGQSILALVDYAHTPDALENVLNTINALRSGQEQVITVVGCGGNRDKDKRPVMASIAVKLSDKVIFTEDNPRSEDPKQIIADMMTGVGKTYLRKALVIQDRKEAIKTACSMAQPGDVILVAGKGHETYQEINGKKFDFDDKKVLKEILALFN